MMTSAQRPMLGEQRSPPQRSPTPRGAARRGLPEMAAPRRLVALLPAAAAVVESYGNRVFHHGMPYAQVQALTHLLIGCGFVAILVALAAALGTALAQPRFRAALRGDFSDQPGGANYREPPPKQRGSKRRQHDYPSWNRW